MDDRIFLIGNGPSLSPQDLNLIAREASFGLNACAKVFDYTRWRPKYYVGVSSASADPEFRAWMQMGIDAAEKAWVHKRADYFKGDHVTRVACTNGASSREQANEHWWSDDPETSVCKFGTSMLVAMQIAAAMKPQTLILLGVDATWTGEDDHMVPGYRTENVRAVANAKGSNTDQPIAYEQIAKPNLERLGIEVLNATRGGRVDCWPRVMLEEVLAVSEGA